MQTVNQNPEQIARDGIDARLWAAGWDVQDREALDFNAGLGIAVREYPTDVGPADYVLFVDRRAVGVVEAKPDSWGTRLTTVEEQSEGYANAKLKWVSNAEHLPFLYEATGKITRFTNGRDPNPRSREVFSFHRPETFQAWARAPGSFRSGIASLPTLNPAGLRECQIKAITNLEDSLTADKPRSLVQMATGSGKTFTAITQVYRLLKHADAERVLFLVDTRNLGEQAEQEFMAYLPNDDNRKFTELYNVQRLTSPSIASDVQVVISTIQRLYATLRGEELAEGLEEEHPEERQWHLPAGGMERVRPKEAKTMRYVSFIHRDKVGYGVSFPDFPGCVSVGDTVDDAVRHGSEALAFHVEGLVEDGKAIPTPRTIDAIKADPALTDWRREADLVLIPLLLDRGSSRRVNISLDRGLLEAIDDEARQRRMTRSAFLATAARREIEAT